MNKANVSTGSASMMDRTIPTVRYIVNGDYGVDKVCASEIPVSYFQNVQNV